MCIECGLLLTFTCGLSGNLQSNNLKSVKVNLDYNYFNVLFQVIFTLKDLFLSDTFKRSTVYIYAF